MKRGFFMNKKAELFKAAGEPYAAGYFEYEDRPQFDRLAHAHSEYLKAAELTPYNGGRFFPCGPKAPQPFAVFPYIGHIFSVNRELLDSKDPSLAPLLEDEFTKNRYGDMMHTVAGFGWLHSLPHYGRIAAEGLDSYRERIIKRNGDLKDGLLDLLDGIETYRSRCLAYLQSQNADPELTAALAHVPFKPARNIYEALVSWNFIYYLDECDNVGRLDQDLLPFYNGEDITDLLGEFFDNVDKTEGFSASVGPQYNDITLQCLKAIKGKRRPQIELRVTPDMPQEYWDAAIDSLSAGGTNPSLYNERGYESAFSDFFPDMPHEDFLRFCGVGCTESSLAGLTNAGSLDAGIHLPYIFSKFMRAKLADCETFDDFYEGFMKTYRLEVFFALGNVFEYHKLRARLRPFPMRTLLVDDCIDKDRDFNNGGARYSWSVVNLAGIVNLIDSMLAVNELVFEKKLCSPEEFIEKLDAQEPQFLADCKSCRCFGVNDCRADAFTSKITNELFDEFEKYRTYQGGRYLPSSIQFSTCADAGKPIPATPDGRAAGTPLADSLGAIHSKDVKGATAMLNSAASIAMRKMPGTPVLNLRLEKQFLKDNLKPLALGYFSQGGLQLQISCLSKSDMADAMEHPEKHENLIVRVGGYSEYFIRLPKDLQLQILSRTEFA